MPTASLISHLLFHTLWWNATVQLYHPDLNTQSITLGLHADLPSRMSNKLNMVKCQWPDIQLQTALALFGWVGWAKWNLKLWNIIHPPFLLNDYASFFFPWRLKVSYRNCICVSSKYADSYSNLSLVILWFKKRRRSWEKGRQHSHFWTWFEAGLTHSEPQIRLKAVPPYIPIRTNLSYHDGVEAGGIWLFRWISRVSV